MASYTQLLFSQAFIRGLVFIKQHYFFLVFMPISSMNSALHQFVLRLCVSSKMTLSANNLIFPLENQRIGGSLLSLSKHELFVSCNGSSLQIFWNIVKAAVIAQFFQLGARNWSVGMRAKFSASRSEINTQGLRVGRYIHVH